MLTQGPLVDALNWTTRLYRAGTRDNSVLKPALCPLANVFSSEFRGSQENELSERRKQASDGRGITANPSCRPKHSKGFKDCLKNVKKTRHPSLLSYILGWSLAAGWELKERKEKL